MKRWIALFAMCACVAGGCGCGGPAGTDDVKIDFWTAPVTEKLYRDVDYGERAFSGLSARVAKGEYESMQLILTPEQDVSSYDLTPNALTNAAGDVLTPDMFTIYKQLYINVVNKTGTNKAYPAGYIPDALVPMHYIAEAGENRIDAGKNQGLWITVRTQTDTPSGVYTGAFDFTADGTEYEIPVSVTVYNFAISQQTHAKTCFMLNQELLINGELDNTDEMYRSYYEEMLSYRISPLYVPGATEGVDAFVTGVLEYYDELSAFGIPNGSNGATIDKSVQKQYLRALVENSTEERNLLSKGYYYVFDLIDEPQTSVGGIERTKEVCRLLSEGKVELVEELNEEGFFADKSESFKTEIENSILSVPNVVTTYYDEELADSDIAYCPSFENFDTQANRDLYAAERERTGEGWWYGCVNPMYPYPTYFIDDTLVGARVASWMQKDYGIDGNLYWSSAMYCGSAPTGGNVARPVDPYEDPQRIASALAANGDGYLFYPGKKYGSSSPFPSLRLESIRDGMEDYEYLYLLDELYAQLAEKSGQSFSSDEVMRVIYDSLYMGSKYLNDFSHVLESRETVASLVEAANGPAGLAVGGLKTDESGYTLSVTVNSGWSVQVNGEEVGLVPGGSMQKGEISGEFGAENRLHIVARSQDGSAAIDLDLGGGRELAGAFDTEQSLDILRLSENSVAMLSSEQAISGSAARLSIANKSDSENPAVAASFVPVVYITGDFDFTSVDGISMWMYNDSDEVRYVSVNITSPRGDRIFDRYALKPREWTYIRIGLIADTDWSSLPQADGISLTFDNLFDVESGEAREAQIYYLDMITVIKKSEADV